MAEYIDRARALDICQKEYEERLRMADYCGDTVAWNIGGAIKVLPAAEVAEVVRCQNCKHRIFKDMGFDIGEVGGCEVFGVALPGDFYCAHGARMDKEDEHEAD